MYIWPNTYILSYAYRLPHRLYILSNKYIRPYAYTLPHLLYIYYLTRSYYLICTSNLPIFWSSDLPIFWSSDLPIFQSSDLTILQSYNLTILQSYNIPCDVIPYGSNVVYLFLYRLLWPCTTYTAFIICNLSTVPGVTPTNTYRSFSAIDIEPENAVSVVFVKNQNFDKLNIYSQKF